MGSVIEITNLSKLYRLGEIGTGTISRDLERWYKMRIRGQEDPFLKIGETNQRDKKGVSDVVYALRDINFEVQQGEAFGIIGKNGAGKSTLLKILSRVTSPTAGSIKVKGRVASLLEVGTGFHPELTGRENIYLNGAILGMRKKEITRKLDEIIDFSGVERYIDTPVKRYSSGMYVRLAFAVAAHLESEILIVDEVLAVGDAEFQKKCLGKMGDLSKGDGRTLIFVSHNMNALRSICNRAILLASGCIFGDSNADEIINKYLTSDMGLKNNIIIQDNSVGDDTCILLNASIRNEKGKIIDHQEIDKEVRIEFIFRIKRRTSGIPNMHLFTADGSHVFFTAGKQIEYSDGTYLTTLIIPSNLLNTGTYNAGLAFTTLNPYVINFYLKEALIFEMMENFNKRTIDYVGNIPGIIRPNLNWSIKQIN